MENRVEKILRQIQVAIAEIDITTGQYPTKIILGIEVYYLIHNYIALCYDTTAMNKDFATLFNIPLSVDTKNVDRISVCVDNNILWGKEEI